MQVGWMWMMVVVERVHVLCVHADVDGGHRHLACACGHGWGTWTPCVHADGLLWMQMSIKKKQKVLTLQWLLGT